MLFKINFIVLVFSVLVIHNSNSARILGVVPMPSYSHQIVFWPIWKELSLRGHQVTVLTTDPINDPKLTNLTEINLHFIYDEFLRNASDIIIYAKNDFFKFFHDFRNLLNKVVEGELNHPKVQELINNKNEHFDLLMVEYFLPSMFAFSERFNCPFIGMTSLDASPQHHELLGNPAHPIVNPDSLLPFAGELTLKERFASIFYKFYVKYYAHFYGNARADKIVETYFGKNYSSVTEMAKKTSLLFINVNPVFQNIRPLGPKTIQIGGGLHIRPQKPLPKDIQKYLDEAKDGVIYMSLGTNVKSKDLPPEIRKVIIDTLEELPYKILWKFETDNLERKPENVKVAKWLPQQDVLRHSNIKLFITQGGLQSIEEAIHSQVPMIGIPFFGDQDSNVRTMVVRGMGLQIKAQTLDKENFKKTILEVLNNPKYRNNIKKLAQLAEDEPMTGLERAIWWTEYVLRHKNTDHLENPVVNMPLYQYYLLDVVGFLVLILTIISYVFIKLLKFIIKLVVNFIKNDKLKIQ